MTINTFVLSGEVKRVDVNNKPTKKGPAAVILLQYGPTRQRTDQAVQFLNVALVRVPPYVYEKCKDHLKVGCLVDVTGHTQGVLKQIVSEGFVTNELVADRLQVVDAEDPVEGTTTAEHEDEQA
ncbi:hypothetical protein [Burkholderia ambifaria]|uniref:hypothetical protein n=1 Tax=Burkholderia ambifaria TaxID=152480 RepID=UPI000F805D39|nr:hypothetical protein [Burkholderia ambifaria]